MAGIEKSHARTFEKRAFWEHYELEALEKEEERWQDMASIAVNNMQKAESLAKVAKASSKNALRLTRPETLNPKSVPGDENIGSLETPNPTKNALRLTSPEILNHKSVPGDENIGSLGNPHLVGSARRG